MTERATSPLKNVDVKRLLGATALAAAAVVWFASCARHPSVPLSNRAPSVRIVRGAIIDRDTVEQVAEIVWIGWDDDGFVDHYQIATDVPDSLVADIDKPTSRVAWEDTTITQGRFQFQTAFPETALNADGGLTVTGRYLGDHSFWVRSVDNEGATSRADHLVFTVANEMPRTTITTPKVTQYASVGPQIYVSWSGKDPDKLSPDLQPVAYEYKLIPLPSVFASEDPQYAVDVAPGPIYPWVRVSGGTNSIRLDLDSEAYWFVIRAIDNLGAVESRFTAGINAIKLESSRRNYDRPRLTVREARFGSHLFPDEGLVVELRVFRDECLKFEFSADLSSYGGAFQGYNVGIDVADLDDFGPDSRFQGWTTTPRPQGPICFGFAGVHNVTILARDSSGGVTVATYRVTVTDIPVKDREVLLIDDFPTRSAGGGLDRAMDQKARDLVRAAGFRNEDVYSLDPWGVDDSRGSALTVSRTDIGRYRLLVWYVEGAAGSIGNGRTGIVNAIGCGNTWLVRYLETGGAVWVYGNHVLGALTPKGRSATNETACSATTVTAGTGMDIAPGDFLCTFMDICGGDFHQVRTQTSKVDGMRTAYPTPLAEAELMPPMEADSTAYNYAGLGGLCYIEAQFGVINPSAELDALYRMTSVTTRSKFNDRAVAWRYLDTDPVPAHGPMAVFLFSLHEMKQGSGTDRTGARGLARSLGDWFRRYLAPVGDAS